MSVQESADWKANDAWDIYFLAIAAQLFMLVIRVLGSGFLRLLNPYLWGWVALYLFIIVVEIGVFYTLLADWSPYAVAALALLSRAMVASKSFLLAAVELIGLSLFDMSFYSVTLYGGPGP